MAIDVTVTYDSTTIATLSNQSSVAITYGGNTIATLSAAGTKTLNCKDKMMSTNVVVGSKTLNCKDKVMKTNVVVTATNATPTEVYIVKAGVVQTGYSFTVSGMKYNSTYSTANSSSDTKTIAGSGYLRFQGKYNSSYATGALCKLDQDIKSLTSTYTKVVFKVKRTIRPSSGTTRSCVGTYNGTNQYIMNNMKEYTEYTRTSSQANSTSYTTITKTLTSTSTGQTNLYLALALGMPRYAAYDGTSYYMIDVTDIYFTN